MPECGGCDASADLSVMQSCILHGQDFKPALGPLLHHVQQPVAVLVTSIRVNILLPAPPTKVLMAATSGVSWPRAPSACVLNLILQGMA